MNVAEKYQEFCEKKGIAFSRIEKVNPYDSSTLFCPAGMQKYKPLFEDKSYKGTEANIQSCIRMNDFDELSDATHLLAFDMVGLFSFREMSVKEAIEFWVEFLAELGLSPDYATIHPESTAWASYYKKLDISIKLDRECTWSDGNIGGYCTEFFINGVEVGNIVNPLGDCIDVGFGLERLTQAVNKNPRIGTKAEKLVLTANKLINSGYKPGPNSQGYVLRKVLREIFLSGGTMEHQFFVDELTRQEKMQSKYNKLKDNPKYKDKDKAWWFDTHGINLDEI